jgi:hypothetical protein
MFRLPAFLLLALMAATPAIAQEEATGADQEKQDKKAEVLAALDLPKKAKALRDKGVAGAEVKEAIREARKKKLGAKRTKKLLEAAEESVDENGPVDNFGAFVRQKLDEGLRGKELAAAIKAEHAARGKGKGWRPKKGKDDPKKGKPDAAGKGAGKGKKPSSEEESDESDDAGPDSGKGKGHSKKGGGR